MAKAVQNNDTPIKTSFNLPPQILENLRYMAFMDRVTQTEIVIGAIEEYTAKWEKKNGKIPARRS